MRLRKQAGIIANIWLLAGAAVAVSIGVAVAVSSVRSYNARLDQAGYDRGVDETKARYSARDNAALQAALAGLKAAQDRIAAVEAKAAAASASVDSQYQKGVKDGKANTDKLVAAARAGALRLRDPGAVTGCSPGAVVGAVPGAAPSPPSDSGASQGRLSDSATQFLLELTDSANAVEKQLAAAQALLQSDRTVCNGQSSNP